MKTINFNKAGRIILRKFQADGTLASPIATPVKIQSIQPSANIKTSELADGNSSFPLIFTTGVGGTVQVTLTDFCPNLYGELMGSTATTGAVDMWYVQEAVIDSGAVTLDKTPVATQDPIIVDSLGVTFTEGTTTPTAGQYILTGSELTFNVADEGKSILITYMYSGTTVLETGIKGDIIIPKFNCVLAGLAVNNETNTTVPYNIIIDKCMPTGDIATPQMQLEPGTWSFTLTLDKPRFGQKAFAVRFDNTI